VVLILINGRRAVKMNVSALWPSFRSAACRSSSKVRNFLHLAGTWSLVENALGVVRALKVPTRPRIGRECGAQSCLWGSALTLAVSAFLFLAPLSDRAFAQGPAAWPQWGQNLQHTGFLAVSGQALQGRLSDQIFDPFTSQEMAESRGSH
jgi:hypothetical protein